MNEINRNIVHNNDRINKLRSDINKMQQSGVCPTCNQIIEVANKELIISEYKDQINELEEQINGFKISEDENKSKLSDIVTLLNTLNNEIQKLKTNESDLLDIIKNI